MTTTKHHHNAVHDMCILEGPVCRLQITGRTSCEGHHAIHGLLLSMYEVQDGLIWPFVGVEIGYFPLMMLVSRVGWLSMASIFLHSRKLGATPIYPLLYPTFSYNKLILVNLLIYYYTQ